MEGVAVNVRANIKQLTRQLSEMAESQIPFATALALTKTAQSAQRSELIAMERQLDRPTPFTKRGVAIRKATKNNLRAMVFIREQQAEYLDAVINGGTRKPKGRAHVLPVATKRNKFGNIPRGRIKKLLQRDDVYSDGDAEVAGIYQRIRGGGVRLLFAYERTTKYTAQYKFYEVAERRIQQVIGRQFNLALVRALRSAR